MIDTQKEIQKKDVTPDTLESSIVEGLLELTKEESNPLRRDYMMVVRECINFSELQQWRSADVALLALQDTPAMVSDMIGRSVDTLVGIRENTGNSKKIVKREMGDNRVAELLDKVSDQVAYDGCFEESRKEAFISMLKTGAGIRKIGFERVEEKPSVWCDVISPVDCGWARCKDKQFKDVAWFWEKKLMNMIDVIAIAPDKAGEIKALATKMQSEWEKLKQGNSKANILTRDYSILSTYSEQSYMFPEQLEVYEFWVKKAYLYREFHSITPVVDQMGNIVAQQNLRQGEVDEQPQQGETVSGVKQIQYYEQTIIATGGNLKSGIIIHRGVAKDHPYIGMIAEFKESGNPFGFYERQIPNQKRINIALTQKVAWNNKALKSPIIADEGAIDPDESVKSSKIGNILFIRKGSRMPIFNTQPPLNMQSIEEGNQARSDMQYSTAAGSEALTGQAQNTKSGIQLSLQQNAAITPLNKWISADGTSELAFWRKVLALIVTNYTPEDMARIVGQVEFIKILIGKTDPMTGQPLEQPLQFPLPLDTVCYDVIIQDKAVSDLNKQQSFNAVEGLFAAGVPFEDTFRIKNSPIKDVDEALASNEEARNDIIKQLMGQIQMLQQENEFLAKQSPQEETMESVKPKGQPNRSKHQPNNARQGAMASQTGQRSMIGGALGV